MIEQTKLALINFLNNESLGIKRVRWGSYFKKIIEECAFYENQKEDYKIVMISERIASLFISTVKCLSILSETNETFMKEKNIFIDNRSVNIDKILSNVVARTNFFSILPDFQKNTIPNIIIVNDIYRFGANLIQFISDIKKNLKEMDIPENEVLSHIKIFNYLNLRTSKLIPQKDAEKIEIINLGFSKSECNPCHVISNEINACHTISAYNNHFNGTLSFVLPFEEEKIAIKNNLKSFMSVQTELSGIKETHYILNYNQAFCDITYRISYNPYISSEHQNSKEAQILSFNLLFQDTPIENAMRLHDQIMKDINEYPKLKFILDFFNRDISKNKEEYIIWIYNTNELIISYLIWKKFFDENNLNIKDYLKYVEIEHIRMNINYNSKDIQKAIEDLFEWKPDDSKVEEYLKILFPKSIIKKGEFSHKTDDNLCQRFFDICIKWGLEYEKTKYDIAISSVNFEQEFLIGILKSHNHLLGEILNQFEVDETFYVLSCFIQTTEQGYLEQKLTILENRLINYIRPTESSIHILAKRYNEFVPLFQVIKEKCMYRPQERLILNKRKLLEWLREFFQKYSEQNDKIDKTMGEQLYMYYEQLISVGITLDELKEIGDYNLSQGCDYEGQLQLMRKQQAHKDFYDRY